MNARFLLFFVFLLGTLFVRILSVNQTAIHYKDGQQVRLETTLLTDPTVNGRYQRFTIEPQNADKIFITAAYFPQYHYGQSLTITGTIKRQKTADGRDIATLFLPRIRTVLTMQTGFLTILWQIRKTVTATFSGSLSPTQSSLMLGIVFGIKENLPDAFNKQLQITGLLHVVAASGMNVTMVAGALVALFGAVLRRQVAINIAVVGIWIYAILAGLEPSILRASIMGTVAFSAAMLGRQQLAFWSLFVTSYLMLMLNPSNLTDVGFQLSFAATLGILLFGSHGAAGKKTGLIGVILSDEVKTTIAAQILTLPILLVTFGQYGLLSIIVNALVLWTIPYLMLLGALAAGFGFILPIISIVFLYASLPLLFYFAFIVDHFSSFGLVFQVADFPIAFVLGYYLLVAAAYLVLRKRQQQVAVQETKVEAPQ